MWHRQRGNGSDDVQGPGNDRRRRERIDNSGNADGGQGSEFVDCDEAASSDTEAERGSAWLRARHWSPAD